MSKDYFTPLPLDFKLLEMLPAKGMIGGVHWRGRRTGDLYKQLVEAEPELKDYISATSISARMRSLHVAGYVQNFNGSNGQKIWARTPEGEAFLATKEEVLK